MTPLWLPGPVWLMLAAAPAASLFENAAAPWGLARPVIYGEEGGQRSLLETTGTGVAVLDFDDDGRPDLFFPNGTRFDAGSAPFSMLYRNTGTRFTEVTSEAGLSRSGWGQAACIGDYDNDGRTDLYTTYYGHNALYRNRGSGFEELAARAGVAGNQPRWHAGCAFVDYDRDGDLDLFVATYSQYVDLAALASQTVKPCRWKGAPVPCGPLGLAKDSNILYRNHGDGTFRDVSAASGVAAAEGAYCFQPISADFDGDGWPDVYVSCDSTPNILYRNNRDGTFTDVGMAAAAALSGDGKEQASMGVTAGDYDGDGRQDVFVTNFSEDTPTLYRNLGNWLFADATFSARLGRYRQYLGWGTLFFDYDNDSWEDLFLANGHVYREIDGHGLGSWRQRKLLYRNLAQGAFGEARAPGAEILRPTASRGAAAEDFNGDGYLDLVVVNLGEPPSLLLNRSRGANWLMVRLAGSKSNRSAIGAVVVVETQGRRQIREVRSSSSYYSASGLRLHFGLGTAGAVDVLEVRWPAGGTSRFRALAANRVVTVAEDQGLL